MEALETQIREQFQKAYTDALKENLSQESPDWDWLVRLYKELRDCLCNLTPRRADLKAEIHESMDVDLFEQMIKNNAFDARSMWSLVTYVFHKIKNLESPGRNKDTHAKLEELRTRFNQKGTTIANFVPFFIREAHGRIDQINKDKQEFFSSLKKFCSTK